MKRSEVKWTLLALAVSLLLTPGSDARDKKKTAKGTKVPVVEGKVVSSSKYYTPISSTIAEVDQKLVKDLVEIINTTESPNTFALTVLALEQLGDKAKSTVPSIIINAERLKIFSSPNAVAPPNTVPNKKQQLANAVAQSVFNLLNGNRTPQMVTPQACGQNPLLLQSRSPQLVVPVSPY